MNQQTALQTNVTPTAKIALSSQLVFSELRSLLGWWYVEMPTWYISLVRRIMLICDDTLSVQFLLKTFFVPWHRDYSITGRGFGIALRLLYLPIAVSIIFLILLVLISLTILWALLPAIVVISILRTPFL